MNIGPQQLEFKIGDSFNFGGDELSHFGGAVTDLAKGHVLVGDIVRE